MLKYICNECIHYLEQKSYFLPISSRGSNAPDAVLWETGSRLLCEHAHYKY